MEIVVIQAVATAPGSEVIIAVMGNCQNAGATEYQISETHQVLIGKVFSPTGDRHGVRNIRVNETHIIEVIEYAI